MSKSDLGGLPALVVVGILALLTPSDAAASSAAPDGQNQPAEQATPPTDLEQLQEWLSGRFDNLYQVEEEKAAAAGSAEEGEGAVHDRLHAIFAPVDLPGVGEHVLYVEMSADDNPRKIVRQRLMQLSVEPGSGAVVSKIFTPSDPSALLKLYDEPDKARGLDARSLDSEKGCEIRWKRKGQGTADDHFVGTVPEGACSYSLARYGRPIRIVEDFRLDADSLSFGEEYLEEVPKLLGGPLTPGPFRLHRAESYRCDARILADSGEWENVYGIEIHDLGARRRLASNRADRLSIHLRRDPEAPETESLVLSLSEYEDEGPVASESFPAGALELRLATEEVEVTCRQEELGEGAQTDPELPSTGPEESEEEKDEEGKGTEGRS